MLQHIRNIRNHPDNRIPIQTTVFVIDSAPIFGQTIADLAIRNLTGCTVIAVRRAGKAVLFPDIDLPLLEGDQITIAGTNAQLSFFEQVFGLSRVASEPVCSNIRMIA